MSDFGDRTRNHLRTAALIIKDHEIIAVSKMDVRRHVVWRLKVM